MHSWLELDASALRRNLKTFRDLCPDALVAPVLKSNAYGHGLEQCYQILSAENPEYICVAYLSEVEQLRRLGYQGKILLVAPVFADQFTACQQQDAEIIIGSFDLLGAWLEAGVRPRAHLKFDTGLSRQGFMAADAAKVIGQLKSAQADVVGVCTHFANVEDVLEHEYAQLQMQRFQAVKSHFQKIRKDILFHTASSASSLLLGDSRMDLCRVGISLYGLWPSSSTRLSFLQQNSEVADLRPVLSWKTKVALVKSIEADAYVGYGCTYRAVENMRIAVLPLGYNDGYLRHLADKAHVLIKGSRCRVIGRISMNLMVVDVSHLKNVQASDEVTLLGADGDEVIEAGAMAEWAETIHYELLTKLHPAIPRHIIHET